MNRPMRPTSGPFRQALRVIVVLAGVVLLAVVAGVVAGVDAYAAPSPGAEPPQDLNTVIGNITKWLVGLLVALATLFLTVGGIRYLLAGGDPGEVSKAKDTLKYAALGYGIAALAPLLVNVLKGFVGGG